MVEDPGCVVVGWAILSTRVGHPSGKRARLWQRTPRHTPVGAPDEPTGEARAASRRSKE
jgi:hypothetical protein